jgi:hypothetical protein
VLVHLHLHLDLLLHLLHLRFLLHLLYLHLLPQVLDKDFTLPIGKAKVMRPGKDVTIVAFSKMVGFSLEAAEQLAKEGIDAEVRGRRCWHCRSVLLWTAHYIRAAVSAGIVALGVAFNKACSCLPSSAGASSCCSCCDSDCSIACTFFHHTCAIA